jgi:signal recognition particle receptor subunit beta
MARNRMVLFNYSTKELTAKVVYYGPGLCGKTTNLQWIHEKLPIKNKGKMLSLATETDRTLFFDFLPIEIGTIRGMRTANPALHRAGTGLLQRHAPHGVEGRRRRLLRGRLAGGDARRQPRELREHAQNLEANEIDPDEIPVVLQYNKRDLPNALPIEILNERMNP